MPASFTKDLDQLSTKAQLEVYTQELPSESCNSRQSYLADDVKPQLQTREVIDTLSSDAAYLPNDEANAGERAG